jgi:MoxR-like ATPase
MLLRGAKARAAIQGREYVIPDDVLVLAEPALAHRLVLSTDADLSGRSAGEVLAEVVSSVDLPEDALVGDDEVSEAPSDAD